MELTQKMDPTLGQQRHVIMSKSCQWSGKINNHPKLIDFTNTYCGKTNNFCRQLNQ